MSFSTSAPSTRASTGSAMSMDQHSICEDGEVRELGPALAHSIYRRCGFRLANGTGAKAKRPESEAPWPAIASPRFRGTVSTTPRAQPANR
jgi:hypothetical protein